MSPRRAAAAAALLAGFAAAPAAGQGRGPAGLPAPFRLPWADRPARVDPAAGCVTAAAVGTPDPRLRRLAPARRSARRAGRARALAAVHGFVDGALARANVGPRVAAAAHGAVDARARVTGVRPLVEGGAVVVVCVPLDALRRAAPGGSFPWSA